MFINNIDIVSQPGDPSKGNEDRVGFTRNAAFAIDGATGLGTVKSMIEDDQTDAEYLAQLAYLKLVQGFDGNDSTHSLISQINQEVARMFFRCNEEDQTQRYLFPTASFSAVRMVKDSIEITMLGDCRVMVWTENELIFNERPPLLMDKSEQQLACCAFEKFGCLWDKLSAGQHEELMNQLRERRNSHNTPGQSVWTLGVLPVPIDKLTVYQLELPPSFSALCCTDGFHNVVDLYREFTDETLIEAAEKKGVRAISSIVRDIEIDIDPFGERFHRFKQSDDCSAICVKGKRH